MEEGAGVTDGMGVSVASGLTEGVEGSPGVGDGVDGVTDAVADGSGSTDGAGEADGVPVGSCDGVADAEGVGERVGVIEGVGLGVGVGVGVGSGVARKYWSSISGDRLKPVSPRLADTRVLS